VRAITGAELLRLVRHECNEVHRKGSHVRLECGACKTTVPVHAGERLPPGTQLKIERDLEPCLGEDWLKERTK
jgi:predicted RNA binding protein YcfA (HicA-like mRNA interferase family)